LNDLNCFFVSKIPAIIKISIVLFFLWKTLSKFKTNISISAENEQAENNSCGFEHIYMLPNEKYSSVTCVALPVCWPYFPNRFNHCFFLKKRKTKTKESSETDHEQC